MDNKKDLSKSIYIGYTPRLILYIVLVPILSVLAVILFYKAFEVDDLLNIRYQELGSINEKILDVNKQETTDKTKIDTIILDMEYSFNIDGIIEAKSTEGKIIPLLKQVKDNFQRFDNFLKFD